MSSDPEDEFAVEDLSHRQKLQALTTVLAYQPGIIATIISLSVVLTALEGIGLGFLLPIIQQVQSSGGDPTLEGRITEVFARTYELLNVPFTLEYIIIGVVTVMAVRFTVGFFVEWLTTWLETNYVRELQTEMFRGTLDARLGYFDQTGSDKILNAIVTRAYYADAVLGGLINLINQGLLVLLYFGVALYLAPTLTVGMTALFVVLASALRMSTESASAVGNRVADAHEQVQSTVQAGTQGIRDVKLFRMRDELFADFRTGAEQLAESMVELGRNQSAMGNAYQFLTTTAVFLLLYFGLSYSGLSLGSLGVFAFATYRLAPQINGLNDQFYDLEGSLPHFVGVLVFLDELREHEEAEGIAPPSRVDRVAVEDVRFSYEDEPVLRGVSFAVERGEFVAFVGRSGVGKSTVVSLLARMYEPDEGRIEANGTPIAEFDVEGWRSKVSVVPQDPYIFDDTLRYNLTVGARDATQAEIEWACEIAQVTEFLDGLPHGYGTELGDNGVRLSGGQRQRVAIARALLSDADVLMLDEATSHLDSELEEQIHNGIVATDGDYAMLVIAHRLSTVTDADRIYAMEDGQIAETGDHQELLEEDGTYSRLHATQVRNT